jgi:hypothetical protein
MQTSSTAVRIKANSFTLVYRFLVLYVNLPWAPDPSQVGRTPSLKNLRLHSTPSSMTPELEQKADQNASKSRLSLMRVLASSSRVLLKSSFDM